VRWECGVGGGVAAMKVGDGGSVSVGVAAMKVGDGGSVSVGVAAMLASLVCIVSNLSL